MVKNPVEYICAHCAEENGGQWPHGHLATSFLERCDCCGELKTLCSVDDWQWPGGIPEDFNIEAGRD